MKAKYLLKKVDGLVLPTRANPSDAGYDVVATSDPVIVGSMNPVSGLYDEIQYIEYATNLYFVPETRVDYDGDRYVNTNFHTDLRPRSSISKYNLVLANSIGLIDREYKNQVMCRFSYIFQPMDLVVDGAGSNYIVSGRVNRDRIYKKGDKIAQLLPMITHDIEFQIVDDLPGSDRGGGFGSTDKKPDSAQPTIQSTIVGFKLGKKTTVYQYYQSTTEHLRISQSHAEAAIRRYDGDVYDYVDYPHGEGLCVVDGSGQVLGKIELSSFLPNANYRRG